jgi:hypothetical protein
MTKYTVTLTITGDEYPATSALDDIEEALADLTIETRDTIRDHAGTSPIGVSDSSAIANIAWSVKEEA